MESTAGKRIYTEERHIAANDTFIRESRKITGNSVTCWCLMKITAISPAPHAAAANSSLEGIWSFDGRKMNITKRTKAMYQQVINNSNTFSFHLFSLHEKFKWKSVHMFAISFVCLAKASSSVYCKWNNFYLLRWHGEPEGELGLIATKQSRGKFYFSRDSMDEVSPHAGLWELSFQSPMMLAVNDIFSPK